MSAVPYPAGQDPRSGRASRLARYHNPAECTRVLNKAQARQAARHEPDAENIPDGQAETIEQGRWRPSDTRRYARRSRTCRPVTSS